MKNFDHYSGMSHETIHNLSMKIKDLNRDISQLQLEKSSIDLLKNIF